MHVYVEMWRPKASWLALSQTARGQYAQAVGGAIQGLLARGVKVHSWSVMDGDVPLAAPFNYFAVWEFPDTALAREFEAIVEGAGWYNYFEQMNLRGAASDPMTVLGHSIAL